MNWFSFIAEMTRALAWPVLIGGIVFFLRGELFGLLNRIVSMRIGSWEAKFASVEAKVAEGISRADPRALPQAERQDDLMPLAEASPRAAIIEAAIRIEKVLRDLASTILPDVPNRPPGQLIRQLQQHNIITNQTAESLQGLFVMRNLAVHSADPQLTPDRAVEFITLANAILYLLKGAAQFVG